MSTYKDSNGNEIILSDMLDHGGEADIYTIAGHDKLLAKIYNAKHPINKQKLQKLQKMCAMYDEEIAKYYAWPQEIIYSGKKAVGFIMENINANNRNGSKYIKFLKFYSWPDRREYFPNADYSSLIIVAKNLTFTIEYLHSKGIVIGDINESNIFVNDTDGTVKLIDCDSYQIDNFLCGVGKLDYTAPELPNQLSGQIRTKNHDYFSMAIALFLILVGKHPYMGVNTPDLRQAIVDGLFCYGENAERKNLSTVYPYSEIYDSLSDEIKDLFEQAFTMTIRPSTKTWKKALEKFKRQLKPCQNDSNHYYNPEYNSCIWCDIQENGFKAFKSSPIPQPSYIYYQNQTAYQNQTTVQTDNQQATFSSVQITNSFSGNKYRHNSEVNPKLIIAAIVVLVVFFGFLFRNNVHSDYSPNQNISSNQNVSVPVSSSADTDEDISSQQQSETEESETDDDTDNNETDSDDADNDESETAENQVQTELSAAPQPQTVAQKQPPYQTAKPSQKHNEYILHPAETILPATPNEQTDVLSQVTVPEFQENSKKYRYDMQKSIDDFYKGVN